MEFSGIRMNYERKRRKHLKAKTFSAHRQHPVAIVRYLTKSFWVLLIPAVRALIAYSFNIASWMRVMKSDIAVIVLFFLYAWLRWYELTYELDEKSIKYINGFIVRRVSEIPYAGISAITAEKYWWQYPLGCSYMLIDTDAKSLDHKKTAPDLKLMISDEDLDVIFELAEKRSKNGNLYKSKISKTSLFAFSLLFSSALSGVAILAAMFLNAGDIVGNKIEETFFGAINSAAETVNQNTLTILSKIPIAAIAVALTIIAGWLISFIGNLLRHINFTLEKREDSITIKDGFFTIRRYYIHQGHINYADLQQNLLMKLFKVMSVNVNCSGYGKGKNEIPVFIPISKSKHVNNILRRVLPDFEQNAETLPIDIRYILIYIGPPILAINLLTLAAGVLIYFFKDWYDMIVSTALMLYIPLVWLLIVKTAAFCTSGISYTGRMICIKYCRGFGFHTIIVPEERIAKIVISRTVFQRMNGSCNIIVYTNSEYTKSHKVIGVSYKNALSIFNKYHYLDRQYNEKRI